MEQRKLSVSEIGRAVELSRILWSGKLGPRRAKVNMDLTDHTALLVAGNKVRRNLSIAVKARQSGEKMRRALETGEMILDVAASLRNELGGHWMFFELIVRGNTPRALKRKINPRFWLDAELCWDKVAGTIEKSVGAGRIGELLTLRT